MSVDMMSPRGGASFLGGANQAGAEACTILAKTAANHQEDLTGAIAYLYAYVQCSSLRRLLARRLKGVVRRAKVDKTFASRLIEYLLP